MTHHSGTTRHYLDHASSSPLRPAALEAMLPFLRDHAADPGRVHHDALVVRAAIEQAREQVAALFGARPREVVFCSTGTESVNAAVWGGVQLGLERHPDLAVNVVTTAVEHSSVREAAARAPAGVRVVGVDRQARFDPDEVLAALEPSTALVSVQLANHEVGTVQEGIPELAAGARARGVLVHVDACAAAGHLPIDFAALGVDCCSVTAHKLGGPAGAAALLVRRGLRLPPLIVGGAQERARRAGFENAAAIVGFGAAAAELATDDRLAVEADRAWARTERVAAEALAVPGVEQLGDPDRRLPHLVGLVVRGVEAEPVLLGLDQRGISVHSGSSCSSETLEPSPVLEAMGVDAEQSLRVSVGWSSTDADIDAFADALPTVVEALRALGESASASA